MDAELNAELENAQQSLLDTYELANVYGDDAAKDSAKYMELMASLCEIRHSAERNAKALETAKSERTLDDFDRVFALELNKSEGNVFHPKKTAAYKAFQKMLDKTAALHVAAQASAGSEATTSAAAAAAAAQEDDIVMASDDINVIDPLTKQRMHDPVRNRLCGHHYEKATVLEAIAINKRLRCPVAGCGNKTPVRATDLIDDEAFRTRLLQAATAENEDPLS